MIVGPPTVGEQRYRAAGSEEDEAVHFQVINPTRGRRVLPEGMT